MKHNDDFPEPETMEEAQNRKLEVNRSILQIQSQLSFSERRNRDGSQMTSAERKAWRAKALRKLSECEIELLCLKAWIQKRRTAVNRGDAPEGASDAVALLLHTRKLLVKHGDKLPAELGELSNGIDAYLQHRA